jgi:hypothetical protein
MDYPTATTTMAPEPITLGAGRFQSAGRMFPLGNKSDIEAEFMIARSHPSKRAGRAARKSTYLPVKTETVE